MGGIKRSRSTRPGSTSPSLCPPREISVPAACSSSDNCKIKEERKVIQQVPGSSFSILAKRDQVITLNIGGTGICTLRSTLLSSPSNFAQWIEDDFKEFDRDNAGRPFFDRDPMIFNHILNYFRGYGMPDDTNVYPFLAEDAQFYGVEKMMNALGCSPLDKKWKFLRGPGVGPDGKEFSTVSMLGICGTEPLSMLGKHFMTFSLEKTGSVEVGVVAADNIKENLMLVEQDQAIGYRSTGELLYKVGGDVQYDNSQLGISDKVTVRVEFVEEFPATSPASGGKQRHGVPRSESNGRMTHSESQAMVSLMTTRPPSMQGPTGSEPHSDDTSSMDVGFGNITEDSSGTTGCEGVPNGRHKACDIRSLIASSKRHYSSGSLLTGSTSYQDVAPARYSAIITLEVGSRSCAVDWPAPVPPLCFAVSMNGSSSVLITQSSPVS